MCSPETRGWLFPGNALPGAAADQAALGLLGQILKIVMSAHEAAVAIWLTVLYYSQSRPWP